MLGLIVKTAVLVFNPPILQFGDVKAVAVYGPPGPVITKSALSIVLQSIFSEIDNVIWFPPQEL